MFAEERCPAELAGRPFEAKGFACHFVFTNDRVFEPPEELSILPGMTARVTVTLPGEDIIRLPSHAVFADEAAASQVWKLNPEAMTVHRTPVKAGELTGGDVEILEGLSMGDQIVVSGVSQLREGMKVRRFQR